jgi:hypothetical protein
MGTAAEQGRAGETITNQSLIFGDVKALVRDWPVEERFAFSCVNLADDRLAKLDADPRRE